MKRILALFALVLTLMSGGSLSAAEDISALERFSVLTTNFLLCRGVGGKK